jgi:hypothetical protein
MRVAAEKPQGRTAGLALQFSSDVELLESIEK